MTEPYGGSLTELLITDAAARSDALRRIARATPIQLSRRALSDLELLATGGFSPLTTFMNHSDYRSVLETMRLDSGVLFPIPITLAVPDGVPVAAGQTLALRDRTGDVLALMDVRDVFDRDPDEARRVAGTTDRLHPLVAEMEGWPRRYVSGPLDVLSLPRHYTFPALRHTPRQLRAALAERGAARVVAFQTRNPMHRVHEELTKRAAASIDGIVLIHPVVGQTRPGDVDAYTRVLCYQELVSRYYDPRRTVLSLLPLAMRMAGPREALWHAIIRRNYGATHMIVGRDHAGPGLGSAGTPIYGAYDAQELVARFEPETGVTPLAFEELLYAPEEQRYVERSRLDGQAAWTLSGTEAREHYLAACRPLPDWFTRPEVAALLSRATVRARQGFCVWLAGDGIAEKPAIANALAVRLEEHGRPAVLLEEESDVASMGWRAADEVRGGRAVICLSPAAVADVGRQALPVVGDHRFVLAEVCDGDECTMEADVRLNAQRAGRDRAADLLLDYVAAMGYLPAAPGSDGTSEPLCMAS